MKARRLIALGVFLGLWAIPDAASACAVCFGGADSMLTKGMNNGILVLLGVVGVVQGGLVAMFYSFWRRGRDLKARRDSFQVLDGGANQ